MIIRNILVITVIAALVPIAMSSVSASTANALFIVTETGMDVKPMELKATRQNGETKTVNGFEITADNVVSVKEGEKIRVLSTDNGVSFTNVKISDIAGKVRQIAISPDGEISFSGYKPGVYVLYVIVDGRNAYEGIVVIGEQPQQVVNKEVTKINSNHDINVKVVNSKKDNNDGPPDPKPPICPEGEDCPPGPEPIAPVEPKQPVSTEPVDIPDIPAATTTDPAAFGGDEGDLEGVDTFATTTDPAATTTTDPGGDEGDESDSESGDESDSESGDESDSESGDGGDDGGDDGEE